MPVAGRAKRTGLDKAFLGACGESRVFQVMTNLLKNRFDPPLTLARPMPRVVEFRHPDTRPSVLPNSHRVARLDNAGKEARSR